VLKAVAFTVSAEVIPPRNGAEQGLVLAQVERLVESGAQFLSVTKGAGGSLRGGSLPIAQLIKEQLGVPCIAHFTCRDLVAPEIENLLMDHHYFGIRNILALRGDPPDGAKGNWQAREGGYSYAYQLIEQIRALNSGRYLTRAGYVDDPSRERTEFCIGAAVYPEHPDPSERIEFFRRKVEAGAEYGITDNLYDAESYGRFLDACDAAGLKRIPVLPGTRILKSRKQALRMMEKFNVRVPESVLARFPADGSDAREVGLEIFSELVADLRRLGAPGVHVYVVADAEIACDGVRAMRPLLT